MGCPCGGPELAECCGPYLEGSSPAPTPEALMRSRYTAYTLADVDYIITTHHPSTSGTVDRENIETWARESDWRGLEILDVQVGDGEGFVEFAARFVHDGIDELHHERSRFMLDDGRWYYVDGRILKGRPERRPTPKVGRNDPCPCGSGKKFKRCCG